MQICNTFEDQSFIRNPKKKRGFDDGYFKYDGKKKHKKDYQQQRERKRNSD